MPRRIVVLLIVLILFLGVFLMVAFRRQAPVIPADELHSRVPRRGETCLSCHGPGEASPRGPNHPFGSDCRQCHFEVGERG